MPQDGGLTDEQWARVAPHIPKHKPGKRGGRPRADALAVYPPTPAGGVTLGDWGGNAASPILCKVE